MKIFALSDPHLSFGTPDKKMDRFGEIWVSHAQKIKMQWQRLVSDKDVVLVPGDISWAKKIEGALADLQWLDHLPGQKIILKGNHAIWCNKKAELEQKLPPSIQAVHNNSITIGNFVFFGSRLWDTKEYSFNELIAWDKEKGDLPKDKAPHEIEKQEKLYNKELERLKLSIQSLPDNPQLKRIGLCHYPPLAHTFEDSRASLLFEEAGAEHVVFGHLHSIKEGPRLYGAQRNTEFHLTSCDYIGMTPKLICED